MKDLKDMLDSVVETIELSNNKKLAKFLTEESDYTGSSVLSEADDPFGGDAGGDPAGDAGGNAGNDAGGGDPFGGDAGGGDPFAGDAGAGNAGGAGGAGGGDGNSDDATAEGDENDGSENSALTDDSHEDDPEFMQGKPNGNDVTLVDTPAAKSIYDVDKIMNTVTTVFQSLSEDQLVENEKVKNAVELIFNGKILNEEDLEFTNLKNALFLIRKIGQKLDIKARNYMNRKIKEPLIKKRDEIKQDIASMKGDLTNTRDMLTSLEANANK